MHEVKKTFSSGFSQPLEWFYSVPDFSKQTFGSLKRLISMQCHLSNYWLTHLLCQKPSTDEHSGLNIPDKKGKKMKQSNWHILAKDVNVTDWMELMILLSNTPFILCSSSLPQPLHSTKNVCHAFWCEIKNILLCEESLKPFASASK